MVTDDKKRPKIEPWQILYWGHPLDRRDSDGPKDTMGAIASLFLAVVGNPMAAGIQPQQCVLTHRHRLNQFFPGAPITDDERQELATILTAGQEHAAYFGRAACRICSVDLGNKDLVGHGFMWPEKAEHYILEHGVWTPGCDRLLVAARGRAR